MWDDPEAFNRTVLKFASGVGGGPQEAAHHRRARRHDLPASIERVARREGPPLSLEEPA